MTAQVRKAASGCCLHIKRFAREKLAADVLSFLWDLIKYS